MIKTQIVRQNDKPVAVILDYKEYVRLKEIEQDRKETYRTYRVRSLLLTLAFFNAIVLPLWPDRFV